MFLVDDSSDLSEARREWYLSGMMRTEPVMLLEGGPDIPQKFDCLNPE